MGFCIRKNKYIDWDDCQNCDEYEICESCPTEEDLESLLKRCQRALIPPYSFEKNDYSLKILTGKPSKAFKGLNNKQLEYIIKPLSVSITNDLRDEINNIASNYFINREMWLSKPNYSEIKDVLEKILDLSNVLSDQIQNLFDLTENSFGIRIILNQSLNKEGHDLLSIYQGIIALYNTVQKTLPCNFENGRRLPEDMPFNLLVRQLKGVFEEVTKEKGALTLTSNYFKFIKNFNEVLEQNPAH